MDDYVLGYAAGIVDGEGCIHTRRVKQGGGVYYYMQVSVTNTNPRLVLFLHQSFGGNIYKHPYEGNCRSIYEWHIFGDVAMLFLKLIRPYIVCKKEEIDVALSMHALSKVRTEENIAEMDVLHLRCKSLKKKVWDI